MYNNITSEAGRLNNELLSIYSSLVEQQDEIISRLTEAVSALNQEMLHLRNLLNCECSSKIYDEAELRDLIRDYEQIKQEI